MFIDKKKKSAEKLFFIKFCSKQKLGDYLVYALRINFIPKSHDSFKMSVI